jgi:apolipoprotein N-acyltransferase
MPMMMRDKVIRFLESFLCAGTSALLIAAAHLYPVKQAMPALWWLSLVALTPFLWRAVKASLIDSIVLGAFLALSYCFVAFPVHSLLVSGQFLVKLLAFNLLFVFYAVAVNRIGKHIGFNAIFIAALWLPLEYALSHYAGLGSIFALSITDSSPSYRIASLFGLLMISFVVVLVNTLLLIFFKRVVEALRSKVNYPIRVVKKAYPPFKEILRGRRWFSSPDVRAPPVASSTTHSAGAAQLAVRKIAL